VVQTTKVALVLNLKTAETLDIAVAFGLGPSGRGND
jgi:hypothetical protein